MSGAQQQHAGTSGVTLAGVSLRNPVVLAAGTCGYADEMADVLDLSKVGAVITKSITPEAREGNAPWRIVGTDRGMLNAIGLANVGLETFLREKTPKAAGVSTVVIASAAGHSVEDYVKVAGALDGTFPAIELNVSCPNTKDGLVFGEDPNELAGLLAEVRPAVRRSKLIVKLSPNAPSIVRMAEAAVAGGADCLSLINTFTAMAIDVETRRPVIANGTAGLSGPGTHPIAVRMTWDVYRRVARDAGVPVLAYGGVMKWQDAAELIFAGATAVGIGTALFVDPSLAVKVALGLDGWRVRQGARSFAELTGAYEAPTK